MDPRPRDRFFRAEALAHWLQGWTIGPNLRVTIHTGLGRWDIGKSGAFNRSMAIAAVNPHASYMVPVAERHRLLSCHSNLRDIT